MADRTSAKGECRHCGASFVKLHFNQKFCHETCLRESIHTRRSRPRRVRICQGCGAEYQPTGQRQWYCAPECAVQAAKRRRDADKKPRVLRAQVSVGCRIPDVKGETRTCAACGRTFDTAIKRDTGAAKACSRACDEWARKYPGIPRPTGEASCVACGDPVPAIRKSRACSMRCYEWLRANPGTPLPRRQCVACGVDISRRSLRAKLCGSLRCKNWHAQHPGVPVPPVRSRACPSCAESLDGAPTKRRFCSKRCGDWWRKYGRPLPTSRSCQTCSTDIGHLPLYARYCSAKCNRQSPQYIAVNRAALARRKARKRGGPTLIFSQAQLNLRLSMYGGRCYVCDETATTVDHVKPLGRGGWHALSNLRPMCRRCNCIKIDTWPMPTGLLRRGGTPSERFELLKLAVSEHRQRNAVSPGSASAA